MTKTISGYALVVPPEKSMPGPNYCGMGRCDAGQKLNAMQFSPAYDVWQRHVRSMIEDDDWLHFLPSRERAIQFQEEYTNAGISFDAIGVHLCQTPLDFEKVRVMPGFAGLDISTFVCVSVLDPRDLRDWTFDGPSIFSPLWQLERTHFVPKLNRFGLLDNLEEALLLRDIERYWYDICPELGEPEDKGLHVFGITIESSAAEASTELRP